MVDLKIVREQYQRMPDDVLMHFAINESKSLTIESFHLLKSEFEIRNLDIGIIEDAELGRQLAEADKLSRFEKETEEKFEESIWRFAFNEKEKGIDNEAIFYSLLKKNITDKYAFMLIESMETRAKELVDHFEIQIIVGWLLLLGGCVLFFLMFNSSSAMAAIWGIILAAGGIVRLASGYNQKRKFQTILNNIEAEKDMETHLYQ